MYMCDLFLFYSLLKKKNNNCKSFFMYKMFVCSSVLREADISLRFFIKLFFIVVLIISSYSTTFDVFIKFLFKRNDHVAL